MERSRGLLSHLAGLLKFIVFLAILALIAFFIIRWAKNRQTVQNTQQTTTQTQQAKNNTSEAEKKTKETSPKPSSSSSNSVNTPAPASSSSSSSSNIPSATQDVVVPNTVGKAPATGIKEDVFFTTIGISALIFGAMRYSRSRHILMQTLR